MNARSIIVLLISFLAFNLVQAGVLVKLQQPPPNQLRAADLWKLTLDNTDTTTYRIRLVGTVDEAGAGRVVDGQSGIISLPRGRKVITYDDVKRGGSVNFKAGKWREAFTRTGNAPSGDYTICVTVKTEAGAELGRDCIQQSVEIMSGPTLVSPADGDTISEGQTLTFTWLPPTPALRDVSYSLKIVEVLGNQSPTEAMQRNAAWFQKGNITATSFFYPASARPFEGDKGYAWQISATAGETPPIVSEVFLFKWGPSISCSLGPLTLPLTTCVGTPVLLKATAENFSGSGNYTFTWTDAQNNILESGSQTSNTFEYEANPSTGMHTYKLSVTRGTCVNKTIGWTVYAYPAWKGVLIRRAGVQATELCIGQDATVQLGALTSGVVPKWEYQDKPNPPGNQWGPWKPWPPDGLGGTILNINNSNDAPDCGPGVEYVDRQYRATIDYQALGLPLTPPGQIPQPGAPIPCAGISTTGTVRIFCPTQAGSIQVTSTTHTIKPVNKICSNNTYPIQLNLNLDPSQLIGSVVEWIGPGNIPLGNSLPLSYQITQGMGAGQYNFTVTVKNGACEPVTRPVTVTVVDPIVATIAGDKGNPIGIKVCPHEDAEVWITSTLPTGATVQWQYSKDCTGNWKDAGTGPNHNTNQIGPIGTNWNSVCWRAIVQDAGKVCDPTESNTWQIDVIKLPCPPGISMPPGSTPKCPGSPVQLTAIPPPCGDGPFSYEWYWKGNPVGTGPTYNAVKPGNYYVVATNQCGSAQSGPVTIKDCNLTATITPPVCCSDGKTPITLTGSGTSTCSNPNSNVTYQWSGPNGFITNNPVLTLDPPPQSTATYTLTVTDGKGCKVSRSITITACPK